MTAGLETAAVPAPTAPRSPRWTRTTAPSAAVVTALFSLGWVFMYADRNILSPVMTVIKQEWGLSNTQLGLASTVFFATYALMQIPTGFVADRFGRVRTVVVGYLAFGIGTILSGLAPGFALFLVFRAFTGIGEGTYYSPVYGVSSSFVAPRWRGLSAAVINSGMAVGISLGFLGSSYLTYSLGLHWSVCFLVFGAATLLVAGLIHYFVGSVDAGQIVERPTDSTGGNRALRSRNHVLTYVLGFCSLYGFFSMLTWLPTYLTTARGIAPAQTGVIASLVPWASIPGAILLSMLARRMRNTRPLIVLLALLGAACQIVIPLVGDYSLVIVGLVVYGLVGKLALDPLLITFIAENTPATMYSRAYGYFNLAGMASSIFAPYVTGALADATGHLESGFYLSAALLLAGALAFCWAEPARR